MWHINTVTGEEGWHICQLHMKQGSDIMVFVREGGIWRIKFWKYKDIRIRAENHAEEVRDNYAMIQSGFHIGFVKEQYTMKECKDCSK